MPKRAQIVAKKNNNKKIECFAIYNKRNLVIKFYNTLHPSMFCKKYCDSW
jgi:hypothetical protein